MANEITEVGLTGHAVVVSLGMLHTTVSYSINFNALTSSSHD